MAQAQNRIGTGEAEMLYQQLCASCYGEKYDGGLGGSLVDGVWNHGESDEAIAAVIRNGLVDLGMVPYKDALTEEQIRSLVIFLREKEYQQHNAPPEERPRPKDRIYESKHDNFRLEKIVEQPDIFWSMNFLPDGRILAVQKKGVLWMI